MRQIEPPVCPEVWIPAQDYPEEKVDQWGNGLPRLAARSPFHRRGLDEVFGTESFKVDISGEESVKRLQAWAERDPRLRVYWGHFAEGSFDAGLFELWSRGLVERLAARYESDHPWEPVETARFRPLFQREEARLFSDHLRMEVLAPICMVRVDAPAGRLDDQLELVELDNTVQLGRRPDGYTLSMGHQITIMAATHAIKLGEVEVDNQTYLHFGRRALSAGRSLLPRLREFGGLLGVATPARFGFAQLLMVPVGWGSCHDSAMPDVVTAPLAMWPRFFEEFYWLREEVDLLDEAVISRAVRWRASVADAGRDGRRARLAVDRLRSVALRESVLDSVLDATIALEGLLSDGARTELTHKLAQRAAAMMKWAGDERDTWTIYGRAKGLYKVRSKIVHGVVPDEAELATAMHIATEQSRRILALWLDQPELRDPREIDRRLLSSLDEEVCKTDPAG